MKHRKITCRIKDYRERGAWAELYFMVLAMSYGLKVSSPYGGFGPYDVGVEDGTGPILRVQVKCTSFLHPKGGYGFDLKGPGGRGYLPDSGFFRALYHSNRRLAHRPLRSGGPQICQPAFHARRQATAKIPKVSGSLAFAGACR